MADKRITELNLITNPLDSDVFALVNNSETKKIPFGSVKDTIHTTYNTSSLVTSVTFNSFTSSINNQVDNLTSATASYLLNSDTSSLMVTGSLSGSTLVFEKGDASTFNINLSGAHPGVGGGLGWARYDDSVYTTSSFLIISESNSSVIPNNGNYTEESFMYSSVSFYDPSTQKIQMENVGDVHSMVVTFKAKAPNANQTHIEITLTSTGATPYDRVSKSLIFAKGNDVWENFYESFHFYADADFVANGNQWTLTAAGGTIHIADVIFFIERTQNHG